MNHDEVDGNNYKDKKDEWLDYVKQGVTIVFSYARYFEAIKETTGFSMEDCLTAPGLGWRYFKSLRFEKDEPINTYIDKYLRFFVRQIPKGGRVCSFNQF